jgi:hypothetical protein
MARRSVGFSGGRRAHHRPTRHLSCSPAISPVLHRLSAHLLPQLAHRSGHRGRARSRPRIFKLAARSPLARIITFTKSYRTTNSTRFKARANHFARELRIRDRGDSHNVWVLHLDDDTSVGPDTAFAMARFIEEQFDAASAGKHVEQGILTYPRQYSVNRFTWLADSARRADDVARFAAMTGSGTRAGLHGELLLVRASVEAEIGWDFGAEQHRRGRPVRTVL